ncbi:MAG: threonine--tRNA ligase [Candidatus Omnitrophica bacterium CG11_big_fil_rev_8_21_14_0_20_45_26]|uniref:Threonine--tRNA ligase n=1 Tax=Candidatus Abzuiibacterium crystallinum TaxID=1974748 RepID=A0A2H0LS08_9BACT|nr:MAG: threonine--tRNA ligase [Candidatus Omnitrophica bacterium CG11_big_fil_rev_8_21_14_0_20_45_26]PIW64958.1 MAG: threonine--tRNA ligase [Candidatus Omnitrophica bacterium CG12_big_fil_rev_8_21_14_0_65_45_16]
MPTPSKTSPSMGSSKNSPIADKETAHRIRHSASHVLAQAMQKVYPGVKLGTGPATDNGFYYDFDIGQAITEEDIAKIEKECLRIIAENQAFKQTFMTKKEAVAFFKKKGEKYKCEIIEKIPGDEVSIFSNGQFTDLCRGPHVANTKEIKGFKLTNVSGAYWRGNESNPMLQRVYGVAFASQKELDAYLKRLEEAKKRDHRKLGRELDLFSFHEESPGIPFFHAKGMIVYNELIRYWREEHEKDHYEELKTPIILKDILWRQSGHYDHYKDNMYFTKVDNQDFAIKPMNCPGATVIYRSRMRSYRDLPLRWAELGLVHRHELSGVLHGLFRVKAFTIDDSHIFCYGQQIKEEISKVIALILRIYQTFGFTQVKINLSTRPKESMGTDEQWNQATEGLQQALESNHIEYDVQEGGGAFYGPKIDFEVMDSIGRTWQCGTIQLDFQMPERFSLEYVGEDGKIHRPVMIHRAVFGSVERFYGILAEHYGGAFPTWLSPVQVKICTISEKHEAAAQAVGARLEAEGLRGELDIRAEKINYKVRQAEVEKIPYVAVIGDREVEKGEIALRARGRRNLGTMPVDDFIQKIKQEAAARSESNASLSQ